MSAKCQWCHRKRPEVLVEVDGEPINVCSNCRGIIETNIARRDDEKADAKSRRKAKADA